MHHVEIIPRPTPLPGEFTDWIDTFCENFIFVVPELDRSAFKEEVTESLRAKLFEPHGNWVADYVRLRFSATRPLKGL